MSAIFIGPVHKIGVAQARAAVAEGDEVGVIAIPCERRVANLKAVSFAYIEQAVEIVLGCHQIVVGQQNVIIVGEKFRALAENVVQALPFWAFSIDPRHVIGFKQIRVIAKITDGEIPVAAAVAR
jgi:hypothetical protein